MIMLRVTTFGSGHDQPWEVILLSWLCRAEISGLPIVNRWCGGTEKYEVYTIGTGHKPSLYIVWYYDAMNIVVIFHLP